MASSVSGFPPAKAQTLEDLLTCPVCLDSLQDPRTLTCLHTFCTNCLEGCRKPHRRDFECPVCKRLTSLSTHGIKGLPIDHRIQQIRDIVSQSARFPVQKSESSQQTRWTASQSVEGKPSCDLCRTQHRRTVLATCHCIQCYMHFCEVCTDKHNSSQLFADHDLILMRDNVDVETLFCRMHNEHPVRYFCKVCHLLLCTICTMDHDASHQPEALEKGIIDKYRRDLEDVLVVLALKLKDINTRAKCLETLRQTHQAGLYQAQTLIKERAEYFVAKIRKQERELLDDAQNKFDGKMRGFGMDKLAEMALLKTSLETLLCEIQHVIKGSPQICLLRYTDLMVSFSSISDTSLPVLGRYKNKRSIRFVPSSEELDLMIGTLQEISMDDDYEGHDEETGSQSPTTTRDFLMPRSCTEFGVCSSHLRKQTILNAVSPPRKDVKLGRIKSVNKPSTSSSAGSDSFVTRSSENGQEEAMDAGVKIPDGEVSSGTHLLAETAEQSPLPASPSSTTNENASTRSLPVARLLFKLDRIGGMPGKLSYPSSVAFLPDGNVVVAENEHRLQVFDQSGQSLRVIGWGKIRPQSVAVVPSSGLIACTDRRDQTVKFYTFQGELCECWPHRMFGMPSGLALSSAGHFVVSDVDRSCISTHGPRGNTGMTIGRLNTLGTDQPQGFACPAHVTVDRNDNIFVSDPSEGSIQMFDKMGKFVLKFSLPVGTSSALPGSWLDIPFHPQGLCVDSGGNIAVCDVDNHRISLFSPEGVYLHDLLTRQNGLKYPFNVAISSGGNEVCVVESHGGVMTGSPHYAVKLFSIV